MTHSKIKLVASFQYCGTLLTQVLFLNQMYFRLKIYFVEKKIYIIHIKNMYNKILKNIYIHIKFIVSTEYLFTLSFFCGYLMVWYAFIPLNR